MAWQQSIPLSSDALRNSQGDLQGNFQALNTWMDVNHYLPNTGANSGKHKFITLPVQSSTPAFSAGETGLYTFLNPQLFTNQMYVNLQDGTKIPMTASLRAQPGWSYLPSGVLMKWGEGDANGNTNILFPVGASVPVFSQIFSVILCTKYNLTTDGNGFARLGVFTATGFAVYGSQRTSQTNQNVGFQYLAIGR